MKRNVILILIVLGLVWLGYSQWEANKEKSKDHLVLYGNVDVRQVDLSFRVPGRLNELFFEEGDLVEEGSLIARLDKQPYEDQIKEASARVQSAQASLQIAEKVLLRRQELISDGSVSQEDLDNAHATYQTQSAALKQVEAALAIAQQNLSYTYLYAPTLGIILTRIREPGTVLNAAEPIYTLSISTPVWVRAYCTEPELGLIYPGMKAKILTDTPNGQTYYGKVGFISPVAEFTPKTVETTQLRTDLVYRLRIYVENIDKGLRQGMPVTVHLLLNQNKGA